jgi:hypothetical protein
VSLTVCLLGKVPSNVQKRFNFGGQAVAISRDRRKLINIVNQLIDDGKLFAHIIFYRIRYRVTHHSTSMIDSSVYRSSPATICMMSPA